ncbi:40S ribosomal protein S15, partial [Lemmus lemmus]
EPWPAADAALTTQAPKKDQEGGAVEKPKVLKTHLRNRIILPKMSGSMDLQPETTGHYLGEFSITKKAAKHGQPGIGATHSSSFSPSRNCGGGAEDGLGGQTDPNSCVLSAVLRVSTSQQQGLFSFVPPGKEPTTRR